MADRTRSPSLTAGAALIRASATVGAMYDDSSRVVGLSAQQARLLFVLARRPTNMLGLGASLQLRKSTLTGIVDRLEHAGLVEREVDPDDRRRFVVTPTSLGASKAREFEEHLRSRVTDLLTELDDDQQQLLAELLTAVLTRAETDVGVSTDPDGAIAI